MQLIEIQIESHAPPSWEEFQLPWPPADTVGEASRSELPGTMWQEEILGTKFHHIHRLGFEVVSRRFLDLQVFSTCACFVFPLIHGK